MDMETMETNTWNKRKRDEIIKNCIDKKYIKKRTNSEESGGLCYKHL